MDYRIEKDSLGEMEIPLKSLYGIHSKRAFNNFPDRSPFPIDWYKSMGSVKKAFYLTVLKFKDALNKKHPDLNLNFHITSDEILKSMITSAEKIEAGEYFDSFIIPAISGGAGTSINMNINEIIANLTILENGKEPGDYTVCSPLDDANIFQSTNDTVPSALKIAMMKKFTILEEKINDLRIETEKLETKYRDIIRPGFTQLQEAVPTSYGKQFSAYNNALSRDWWRVSKCFERIKVLNLGGSAIGTGMAVPRFVIMEVINTLKNDLNLPLARSENMVDTTSNLDTFVEVHAILKSLAVNLEKMSSDIRLLASDLTGGIFITIPPKQAGSSIMPGKVNPVIVEYVVSAAAKIYANDSLITALAAKGNFELNAYLPIIGVAMLESLDLLIGCCYTVKNNLIIGITVNENGSSVRFYNSPSITTALVPYIGYEEAAKVATLMKTEQLDIFKACQKLNIMNEYTLKDIVKPENLLKLGFSMDDIIKVS
ncbi:MAG: aspartate ammonia-lyase [Candidatus Delongbacteria bacterium]|nr:aspartate ammonia-lyase [Candidatus Delongbacteria bacterium]MBN2833955.1 aspartate ammonia-lyase [Candidatus Delongbacteria bacterium]